MHEHIQHKHDMLHCVYIDIGGVKASKKWGVAMDMLFQIAKHTCAVMLALCVNEFVQYSVCDSEQG